MVTPGLVRIDKLDLFKDCTEAELRHMDSLATYLRLPKNRVLMRQRDPGREFVTIVSGHARVTRETHRGVVTVAEVGRGDFLGEIALLTGEGRTATATAITELEILVSSTAEFQRMLQVAPSVAQKIRLTSIVRAESAECDRRIDVLQAMTA
jgi:CRP/FNR family cyclic AMP-dependent transcriptional regulator